MLGLRTLVGTGLRSTAFKELPASSFWFIASFTRVRIEDSSRNRVALNGIQRITCFIVFFYIVPETFCTVTSFTSILLVSKPYFGHPNILSNRHNLCVRLERLWQRLERTMATTALYRSREYDFSFKMNNIL